MAQAKTVWRRMLQILSREVATPQVFGFFFKSVIQAVLLFRADSWGVTPLHGKCPEGVSDPGGETADGTAPA